MKHSVKHIIDNFCVRKKSMNMRVGIVKEIIMLERKLHNFQTRYCKNNQTIVRAKLI